MGVKINRDKVYKYTSTKGGTSEFWAQCAIDILTRLCERGLPINMDSLESRFNDSTGYGGAVAYFIGEEWDNQSEFGGSYIGISFYDDNENESTGMAIYISGGFNNGDDVSFKEYSVPIYSYIDLQYSNNYYFNIRSYAAGDSFVFELEGFDPFIITPMRSLSNPNKHFGYGMVSAISYFNGLSNYDYSPVCYYYKSYPYIKDYDYSNLSQTYPFIDESISTKKMPERSTGKIITIPLFTGVEDIYYQDVYLTNLAHTEGMAKAYETDQGVLLVVESDLVALAEYIEIELCTSWEQYPTAQIALDISSTYNA